MWLNSCYVKEMQDKRKTPVLIRRFKMGERRDWTCPDLVLKLRLVGPQRRRYVMPAYPMRDFSYATYLESSHWRKIREEVLIRDCGRCRVCNVNRASQVHHLTYERIGRELTVDLIAICAGCHEKHHGKGIVPDQ